MLGSKLRMLRKKINESLAEAAGAVEIDESMLRRIEQGEERPTEEILMLLINHFRMSDSDAMQLWELAGYDQKQDDAFDDMHGAHADQLKRTIVMAVALDPRIMYSDSVHVAGNPNGIVLNFLQSGVGAMPSMPVSRVGMSREQAKQLVQLLQSTLDALDNPPKPKQLPPSAGTETSR